MVLTIKIKILCKNIFTQQRIDICVCTMYMYMYDNILRLAYYYTIRQDEN